MLQHGRCLHAQRMQSEFLVNLPRNWTVAWPRAIFTAAKHILGVFSHQQRAGRCFSSSTVPTASTGQRLLLGSLPLRWLICWVIAMIFNWIRWLLLQLLLLVCTGPVYRVHWSYL